MGKKVISYALWGKKELYVRGALENIRNRDTFLPDWICRFYIGERSMDPAVIERLESSRGVEVVRKGDSNDVLGMFWRFEAMYDDPDVERMLSRDTDCQFTWREVDAIRAWERSGEPFHVIRDNAQHNIPILGGTWGAVRDAIPNMKDLAAEYLKHPPETKSQHPGRKHHGVDQLFLNEEIWPLVHAKYMGHIHGGMPKLRFSRRDIELPYLEPNGHFVGQPCVDLQDGERKRPSGGTRWDSIALFLPTFKRPQNVRRFVETAFKTAVDPDRLRLSLCVNRRDEMTCEFIDGYDFPIAHEVIWETTRQPNLSKYFNMLYEQTSFNSDGTVVTMFGDDMYFKTSGWDQIILDEINSRNGNAIVYCNDGFIAGKELAVNLATTRKVVDGTERPFMCPEFHAEMIDVVWTVVGSQTGLLVYLPNVIIQHDHGSKPGNDTDETYMRLQPLRGLANTDRNMQYARVYATICAANLVKNGIGEWSAEALIGGGQ